jgi:hypothetical protein
MNTSAQLLAASWCTSEVALVLTTLLVLVWP